VNAAHPVAGSPEERLVSPDKHRPSHGEAAVQAEVNELQRTLHELELLGVGGGDLEAGGTGFEGEVTTTSAPHRQIAAIRAVSDADGYDLRPDPLNARTPAEFTAALRQFRIWAGEPSLQKMSSRTSDPHVATSTLCSALRGDILPTYSVVTAVITACGGSEDDQRRFATAWRKLRFEQEGTYPHNPQQPGGCAA
jgi:hypothetical protein